MILKKEFKNSKYILFYNYNNEKILFIRRLLISSFIILILSIILIINLYYLQIIYYQEFKIKSDNNRIKFITIPPNRGNIYDRNGIILALNKTFYNLEVVPKKNINLTKTLSELRNIVNLTDFDIKNFKEKFKYSRNFISSIILKSSLNKIEIARFVVNKYRFPGFQIKSYQYRYYPYSSILTHVIGYVGKINNNDIEYLKKNSLFKNYKNTYNIGKFGIEKYYENILHGKSGYKKIEVNSKGKIIRQIYEKLPQAGKDIYLTIDLNLQIKIKKLLNTSRAAVIVTNPHNGQILALISNPSYDSNLFINGISIKDYKKLLNNPDHPLINRATQGLYPPASTIKPFIAIAALSENIITSDFTIFDPGWWHLPNSKKYYRDWKKFGHGKLNLIKAIIESSDTFFYQIAYNMGIDLISNWMQKFSYGHYTGIDLTEEYLGIMPTRKWKKEHYKKPWYLGDTISVGIGQGYCTVTPIQMIKALMILINNGKVKIPHLLYGTKLGNMKIIMYNQKKNTKIKNIDLKFWQLVKDGMYGVANTLNGTAYKSFINTNIYQAAIKSGTAQVFSYKKYQVNKLNKYLHDHKLMIGFAPYKNPTVSIVVILENGGTGLTVGNFVRNVFDYIFLKNKLNK